MQIFIKSFIFNIKLITASIKNNKLFALNYKIKSFVFSFSEKFIFVLIF